MLFLSLPLVGEDGRVDPRIFAGKAVGRFGQPLRIVVMDMGPFDMLTHLANTRFPRVGFIRAGMERLGGCL